MNIYNISGGLGNQLFQYAFYKFVQQSTATEHYFYIGEYDFLNSKYNLKDTFSIDVRIVNDKSYFKFFNMYYFNFILLKKIYIKLIKLLKKYPVILDNNLNPSSNYYLNKNNKNNIYIGYWQSWQYVSYVDRILRNDLQFPELVDPLAVKESHLIIKSCNSTSIHIRRGDYLTARNSRIFYSCSDKYYADAIQYVVDCKGPPTLFVFSDDIEWVKLNFNFNFKTHYIYHGQKDSYLDMHLMSLCKNNIIANSTFSWWGAWFNDNPDKIVICPSLWSLNINSRDIAFPDWKII